MRRAVNARGEAADYHKPDLAPPKFTQELRRIRAELKPGRYRMKVLITDLDTGQNAVREKLFLVLNAKAAGLKH